VREVRTVRIYFLKYRRKGQGPGVVAMRLALREVSVSKDSKKKNP
jgi:hypothetical protein